VLANFISTIGGAMSLVALPWFVFSITRSAALTGVSAFCEFSAVAAASTCAGWFIRRLGARSVRALSDLVSGVAVLAIPALFELDLLPFSVLLVLVAINGFLRTPAVAASYLLLATVAKRAATTTDAISGQYLASLQFANAIGAPLAGATIAAFGAPVALIGDSVTFFISATLVQLFLPSVTSAHSEAKRPSVLSALRSIWDAKLLRLMISISILLALLGSGWGAVIAPLYGTEVLGSAAALGTVLAAQSIGAILGAGLASRVARRIRLKRLVPLLVASAIVPLFAALAARAPVAVLVPAAFIFGAALGAYGTVLINVEYRTIPGDQQGHMFGILTALSQSGTAIGPLLTGLAIDASSLAAFAAAAASVGTVLAVTLRLAKRLSRMPGTPGE